MCQFSGEMRYSKYVRYYRRLCFNQYKNGLHPPPQKKNFIQIKKLKLNFKSKLPKFPFDSIWISFSSFFGVLEKSSIRFSIFLAHLPGKVVLKMVSLALKMFVCLRCALY